MIFIQRTLPLLFGIFLLSVAVRLPLLDRPLSKHHEFCTAVSLRVLQAWYDEGIENFHYNPVMNYSAPTDKFINNHANTTGKMVDANGNFYYVSHPPFAYYVPFYAFKILHIRPDVLPLQVFNLVLNLISALFIYFTVCLLSFNRARSLPYRPALVAYAIYLFLPATLWFQGNVYMSDMAVHTLYIIGVYIALKMIIRQKFYSPKYIGFYVLALGLMIYASWLGVFFAAGVLVYSLLHVHDNKGFRVLIWSTILVGILMLRTIVYQYAQINGPGAYLSEMISRYMVRGSLAETQSGLLHFVFGYLWMAGKIVMNYGMHYAMVFLWLLWFMWIVMSRKKLKIVFSQNGYRFIWLSVMPVVMLHVVFMNYSGHDFTVLYASLFFSVLIGILYDKVKKTGAVPVKHLQLSIIVSVVVMIATFYAMNYRPAEANLYRDSAENIIMPALQEGEVAFMLNHQPDPQLVFYAQRNIKAVNSEKEAVQFLQKRGFKKGVLFSWSSNGAELVKEIEAL